ncbi:MAG: aminotransferase class V-fold PLP-dependent enzyme [Chloroflexota bacterium]|nr:aminotransferase class V-fold PLP-dependent enzyme [Chloroflexota bacterium]
MIEGPHREGPARRPGEIYRRLGVEPVINGATTMTALGGSLMPPEVVEAMREAGECFVDLLELQDAVGRRIAEVTRNEAAFVSAGAAAGLALSAAVCMARGTGDGVLRLAEVEHLPRDFVIQRGHRNPFDPIVELVRGRIVEIPDGDERELRQALRPTTAAILFLAGELVAEGTLPLERVVPLARECDVPVIVDAAAQLPPPENLWRFTQAGADIVLFSGGKALSGPAATGLVLGTRRYIERFAPNASPREPREAIGRPMKLGKEELIGILAAVEWYLRQDQDALTRRYEATVEHFVAWGRGRDDVKVTREPRGEAGQPVPRARIALAKPFIADLDAIMAALRSGQPRVDLLRAPDGLYVAPETLQPTEELIISRRLEELLDERWWSARRRSARRGSEGQR